MGRGGEDNGNGNGRTGRWLRKQSLRKMERREKVEGTGEVKGRGRERGGVEGKLEGRVLG